MEGKGSSLHSAHLLSTHGNKQNLSKLFCFDTNSTTGILRQDVHGVLQCQRINFEVVSRDLLESFNLPRHRRVVSMVVLGTKPETCHGAIIPRLREILLIMDEIGDSELVPLDPELACPLNGGIHHDAGVCYDNGIGVVVGGVQGSGSRGMASGEEVLESAVLFGIGGDEVVHVYMKEFDESLDQLLRLGRNFFLFWVVLAVTPGPYRSQVTNIPA